MSFPGIVLPEEVTRNIAQSVIDKLDASDLTIVEWVVGQLSPAEQDSLRTAFRNRPGKARLGYALEQAEDWQITVCLSSTSSAGYRTIGDLVGPLEEDTLATATLTADIAADRDVLLPLDVVPPTDVAGDGGRVRLEAEVAVWRRDPDGVRLPYRGLQGTAAAAHPLGTSVRFHTLSQRMGWGETVQVRCDVLSTDAWFNMILGTMVKAALLTNAAAFENSGVTLHDISESELTPRPEMWPVPMMHRTLLVTLQRDFAVPEAMRVILDITTDVQAIASVAVVVPGKAA
jgi:hypothetical protein